MAFTPPSRSLGIDRTQDEPVNDPMPIAFAFPAGTVPMMAQPIADGKKVVKFADPIVQGKLFLFPFCSIFFMIFMASLVIIL